MRRRLLFGAACSATLCLAVVALSPASRSGTDDVSSGAPEIRVQGRAVPDPLEQLAKSRGLRLNRGASVVTQIGELSESELVAVDERTGEVAPRSICKTVALSGGGGSTSCKRVGANAGSGEPLVSVTVLGNERYALSALFPAGAREVRLQSRTRAVEQEVRLVERMFGLQAGFRDLGTLRYETARGEARSVDLRWLAENAATG